MKKGYVKPIIEIELYHTNSSIASCIQKVSWGPDAELNSKYGYGNAVCSEYEEAFEVAAAADSSGYYQNWYQETCSCYMSSGNTMVSS